jgi:NADH:ubiquinone oxidoreductase subunit 5 (subunit L)/multisubunit Na+/H+ antiporter MnhA subunit
MGLGGLTAGYLVYRGQTVVDPVAVRVPRGYGWLARRWGWDELYAKTLGKTYAGLAVWTDVLELAQRVWVELGVFFVKVVGLRLSRVIDGRWLNEKFFDGGCGQLRQGGEAVRRVQSGYLPGYLRYLGAGVVVLALIWRWGS